MSSDGGLDDKQFAAIWKDSCDRYTQITGTKMSASDLEKLTSANALLDTIDAKQGNFEKYREKRAQIRNVLSPAMKTVELFGNLVSGGASMAFPPSAVIFGAVTQLLQAAKNVSSAYDSIIGLFDSLKAFVTRLQLHGRRTIALELKAIMVKKLSVILVVFGLSSKYIKEGRALKFVKNVFKGEDDEIKKYLGEIEVLSRQEDSMVQTLNLSVSYANADGIANVQQSVTDMGSTVQANLVEMSHEMHRVTDILTSKKKGDDIEALTKRLREHLDPEVSVQADYDNLRNEVVPGTCSWIFNDPQFEDWIKGRKKLLWLNGGPGFGKSHISAHIVNLLQSKYPQQQDDAQRTSISYFFCREADEKKQSFSTIIRTLAHQIALNDQVYAKYLLGCIDNGKITESMGMAELFKITLEEFFKNDNFPDRAYVVLDGIDEAFREGFDGAETFFELLHEFYKGTTPRVRILLVGRPEMTDLLFDILEDKVPMIELSHRSLSADIEKYIEHQVSRSRNLRRISKSFREDMVKKLSGKTFLWVKLVLKEIGNKTRESQMREALDRYPKDLGAMIGHVLERFSNNDEDVINDLNALLSWVVCSHRPLTLGEIETFMTMNSEDLEPIFDLERLLRVRYSTFFSLYRADGLGTADLQDLHRSHMLHDSSIDDLDNAGDDDDTAFNSPKTTVVTISHLSFTEYFRNNKTHEPGKVGLSVAKAEVWLSLKCMSYFCNKAIFEKFHKLYHSTRVYAADNWVKHLHNADPADATDEEKKQIIEYMYAMMDDTSGHLMNWIGVVGYLGVKWFDTDDHINSLMKWIKAVDADLLEGNKEILEWKEAVIEGGPSKLMQKLVLLNCDQIWKKVTWLPLIGFHVPYMYVDKFKLFPEGKTLQSGPGKELVIVTGPKKTNVKLEDVLLVADWTGFEQDALFCYRVGQMFLDGSIPEIAIEWFQKAIEKEEHMAYYLGLARANAKLKKYEDAVELAQKAEEIESKSRLLGELEDNSKWKNFIGYWVPIWLSALGGWDIDDYDEEEEEKDKKKNKPPENETAEEKKARLAKQKEELEDESRKRKQWRKKAVEAWKASYDSNYKNFNFVKQCLYRYEAWEMEKEFINLMRLLESKKTEKKDKEHSLLADLLLSCGNDGSINSATIFIASKEGKYKTDRKTFLVEAYEEAKQVADSAEVPVPGLANTLGGVIAAMHLLDPESVEKATPLLERLAEDPTINSYSPYLSSRSSACAYLAQIYYRRACKAEKDGNDFLPHIEKLENVTRLHSPLTSDPSINGVSAPLNPNMPKLSADDKEAIEGESHAMRETTLLLGMWYRNHGDHNKAREYCKDIIGLALDLLNDDIDENDNQGFDRLGYALLLAGDERNARAAYQMISQYRERFGKAKENGGVYVNLDSKDEENDDDDVKEEEGGDDENKDVEDSEEEYDSADEDDDDDGDEDEDEDIDEDEEEEELSDENDWFYWCDNCDGEYYYPEGMYLCKSGCLDTALCLRCYKKMKKNEIKGTMPFCNSEHDYFYVSQRGLPKREKGMVKFVADENNSEETMKLEEWYKIIREKWID